MRGTRLSVTLIAIALAGCPPPSDGDKTDDTGATDTDTLPDGVATPEVRLDPADAGTLDDLTLVIANPAQGASYLVQWTQDGSARPDLRDQTTVPASNTAKGEAWKVTVVATVDGEDSTPGTAEITIGNTPPSATVTLAPESPTSSDPLVATVETSDPDGDEVTWDWGDVWSVDGSPRPNLDSERISATFTAKGQTWTATVVPTDGEDEGEPAAASVTVVNAPPVITNADLSPLLPRIGATLEASVQASDPDGDPDLSVTYDWYVDTDTAPVLSSDTSEVDRNDLGFGRDSEVWFVVRVGDGTDEAVLESNHVVIQNTIPRFGAVSITPGAATEATTLTCEATGWVDPDGDPETYQWQWEIDGLPVTGATGQTVDGSVFDRGDTVTCTATPYDGETGDPLTSGAVVIANDPPTVGRLQIQPGIPKVDQVLTAVADPVGDLDGDKVNLTYRWVVAGAQVPGITSSTLSGVFAPGDIVQAFVTPNDGFTDGLEVASGQVRVVNTPPSVTDLVLTPEDPVSADTLVASAVGVDPDPDQTVTLTYTWYVEGTEVREHEDVEGDGDTLPPTAFARGDEVRVSVRGHDGVAAGAAVEASVDIGNTLPTVSGVGISPSEAFEDTVLTCVPGVWTDPDGDAEDYLFRWYVGGTPRGALTPTLTGIDFSKGQAVQCGATPRNFPTLGTEVRSGTIVIRNSPPKLASVRLTNAMPGSGDTVGVVLPGATDVDGDTVTFLYEWLVNDEVVSNAEVLSSDRFGAGDRIVARVTPFDGTAEGDPVLSDQGIGQNTLPDVGQLTIEPIVIRTLDDIVARVEASDEDGHTLAYTYTWTVNGLPVDGITGDSLPASETSRGDLIRVSVSVDDGFGGVVSRNAGPVVVINTIPTVQGAAVEPQVAYEDTVLSCVGSGWDDPDGDPERYETTWLVNGFTRTETTTIDGSEFGKGDRVACRLRPKDFDVTGAGSPVTSDAVTVLNTAPVLTGATLDTTEAREADTVGVVIGQSSDLDGDELAFDIVWLVDGGEVSTGPTIDGALFSKDQVVQARVTPRDDEVSGASVLTEELTISNTAPEVVQVGIGPAGASAVDDLVATTQTTDEDGDGVTVSHTWRVNGSVAGGSGDTLPSGSFQSGDRITVTVVPFDGEAYGPSKTSPEIRIGNGKPSITGVTVTPTEATEATTLTCLPSGWSDPDGDPAGYQYRWKVNGVTRSANSSVTGLVFNKGDEVVCEVTPYDGAAFGDPLESDPVVIGNSPPTLVEASLSTVAPRERDTVAINLIGVSDLDGDPVIVTVTWYVNDVEVANGNAITGALFDKGDEIRAVVDLTDGEDGLQRNTGVATAVNTVPRITSLDVTPENPTVTEDVVAAVETDDPDPADTVTLTYAWTVADEPVADLDDPVLPAGSFVKRDTIRVVVTPHDGTVSGSPVASVPLSAINAAPQVEGVVIDPLPMSKEVLSSCVVTGWSDPDGDDVSFEYRWYVGSQLKGSSPQLAVNQYFRGDEVHCRARAYDGETTGPFVLSETTIVGNTPPKIGGVLIDRDPAREDDLLSVLLTGVTDVDGDSVATSYAWYVNDVLVSTATRLDGDDFSRGDEVRVVVTPTDGRDPGEPVSSQVVTVVNTVPEIATGPIVMPSSPGTLDDITASASATDADGDATTIRWDFFVDEVLVQSGPSPVLSHEAFVKGQVIRVVATPSDGFGEGTPGVYDMRAVRNTPPGPPTMRISPDVPYAGEDDLVCSQIAPPDDPDTADTFTYEFRWLLNGVVVFDEGTDFTVNGSTSVLDGSNVIANQNYGCEARAYDGTAWSAWTATPSVQGNRPRTSCLAFQEFDLDSGTGMYRLSDTWDQPGDPYIEGWCDMDRAGGGWTRIVRTTGTGIDVGQNTMSIVSSFAAPDASEGVYETFDFVREWEQMMLVQVSGAQAGAYRVFQLQSTDALTVFEILEACRDETPRPNDDTAFLGQKATGHTAFYSGVGFEGTLSVYDWGNGAAPVALDRVFICGVNLSSDNDVSYLAFTDARGDVNDWGDFWRGPNQVGTIWSFANGDYFSPSSSKHIGGGTLEGYMGPKWVPATPSATYHPGTYEVYVR